jgi:acyl-CoA dehydrogenase
MTTSLQFDPVRLPPECAELRSEVRAFLAEQIAAGAFDPHRGGDGESYNRRR